MRAKAVCMHGLLFAWKQLVIHFHIWIVFSLSGKARGGAIVMNVVALVVSRVSPLSQKSSARGYKVMAQGRQRTRESK